MFINPIPFVGSQEAETVIEKKRADNFIRAGRSIKRLHEETETTFDKAFPSEAEGLGTNGRD
ncbi:hypothetical protein A1355_02600 [Methylomonas koyamae]|uniref:Uncharacterized protein n=1 Tax=Methylomonas koyamae TaxID=702114 RepID=A0A177NTK3_9GAMM|nr:hypothetical protein A1355_02600 [Methylomonas koyamae]